MTLIVEEHNLLNGYRFSLVEYGGVATVFGLLVAYYVMAGRLLDAMLWSGLVLNCVAIALAAWLAVRRGCPDYGWFPMRRRAFRDEVARTHPQLGRRTTLLVLTSLPPYVLAGTVLVERLVPGVTSLVGRRTAGSLTVKVDPDGSTGANTTLPPCAEATAATIARPSPAPPASRLRDASDR